MKLFLNKRQKRRSIISFVLMVPIFMAFMPYGSFDPTTIGFWIAILNAALTLFLTLLLMVRYHNPEDTPSK